MSGVTLFLLHERKLFDAAVQIDDLSCTELYEVRKDQRRVGDSAFHIWQGCRGLPILPGIRFMVSEQNRPALACYHGSGVDKCLSMCHTGKRTVRMTQPAFP
jgi:hypothetical protein